MSTEICTLKDTGSRNVDISVTRYYGGGKKGPCVQLTAMMESGEHGHIQLSASDIVAILPMLKGVIDDALQDKKREAEEAIAKYKDLEKTIVSDIRHVAGMCISQKLLDVAALLSLGKTEVVPEQDKEDR